MFKRKYPVLLRGHSGNYIRRAEFTIEGPLRLKLVPGGSQTVMILKDDGAIEGSVTFKSWEPL